MGFGVWGIMWNLIKKPWGFFFRVLYMNPHSLKVTGSYIRVLNDFVAGQHGLGG